MNVQATDCLIVRTERLAKLSVNRKDESMVSRYSRKRMTSRPTAHGASRLSMNDNYITYIVSCWSHRESVTIKCCRACTAGRGSARRTLLAFRHRGQRPVPAFQSRVGLRVASDNNNQDGVEIYVNCNRRKTCSLVTPSAGPGPGQAEIRSCGPGRAEKFRPVQYL